MTIGIGNKGKVVHNIHELVPNFQLEIAGNVCPGLGISEYECADQVHKFLIFSIQIFSGLDGLDWTGSLPVPDQAHRAVRT